MAMRAAIRAAAELGVYLDPVSASRLGFGRIVASEPDVPNMLAILVQSE
jgi:hypothetical protein